MTNKHINKILDLCDSIFGPDDNGPLPTDGEGVTALMPAPTPIMRGRGLRTNEVTFNTAQALAVCGGRTLCNNTTVRLLPHGFAVRLHQTDILTYDDQGPPTVVLNSGGWQTLTTKSRLNALLFGTGYHIFQDKGTWFVQVTRRDPMGNTYKANLSFRDGMTLTLS